MLPPNPHMLALNRPFSPDRIEWRLAMSGIKSDGSIWARCLAYIDNRAAMERLDEVFGPHWSHSEDFRAIGNAAVCTVTIAIGLPGQDEAVPGYPRRSVTGSCAVEANDDIDEFKTAASGAMKRAVVNLGVGRYLYNLPEAWANISPNGSYSGVVKDKEGKKHYFKWDPPALPAWALPDGSAQAEAPQAAQGQDYPPVREAKEYAQPAKPAQPAQPGPTDASDPWAVQVHFGKNKGKALRDLPENTLKWYLEKWEAKPYQGRISKLDALLAEALDKIRGNGSQPDQPPIPLSSPDDEVPF